MKLLYRIKTFFSNMATRELDLWGELLLNIIIALYYFPGAFRLIKEDKWRLEDSGAVIGLIAGTIVLAIIAGALITILISIWRKPAKKDERDYRFSARGSMIAYVSLSIFVMLIIGQVLFEGLLPQVALKWWIITSPLIIAHLLMLSIMFSSTIKSVVQLFFYRRGY